MEFCNCDYCGKEVFDDEKVHCLCCDRTHCLRCSAYLKARAIVDDFEHDYRIFPARMRSRGLLGRIRDWFRD